MKRFLFLLIALLSMLTSGYGQFRMGLKGGMNYRRVTSTWNDHIRFSPSAHLGVFTSWHLREKIGVTSEYLLSDMGGDDEHLLYLALPVMADFYFKPNFSVQAGMGMNFWIVSLNDSEIERKSMNWLDIGALIGVRYQIQPRIALSLRFEQGLSNTVGRNWEMKWVTGPYGDPLINNSTQTYREAGLKAHHQNLQLSIYYTLKGHNE